MTDKTQPTDAGAQSATDRDTHFYLAGWNGARWNEDSHEHFRRTLQAAPPAPAAVAVPAPAHDCCNSWFMSLSEGLQAALRDAKWMLAHAAFDAGRAALDATPAQAQGAARSITIDFKQATELLAMFGGEPAEVTLMTGDGHSGNGLYASYTDMPEEGAGFLGTSDNEAMPEAPAQEHATQLAGQGWDRIKGGLSILMLGFAKRTSPTTLKAAEEVLDAATEPGAPLAMLRAAAPIQAQEDAPAWPRPGDLVRYDHGATALVLHGEPHAGGWHGIQCMGGYTYYHRTERPSDRDRETWTDCAVLYRNKSMDEARREAGLEPVAARPLVPI